MRIDLSPFGVSRSFKCFRRDNWTNPNHVLGRPLVGAKNAPANQENLYVRRAGIQIPRVDDPGIWKIEETRGRAGGRQGWSSHTKNSLFFLRLEQR